MEPNQFLRWLGELPHTRTHTRSCPRPEWRVTVRSGRKRRPLPRSAPSRVPSKTTTMARTRRRVASNRESLRCPTPCLMARFGVESTSCTIGASTAATPTPCKQRYVSLQGPACDRSLSRTRPRIRSKRRSSKRRAGVWRPRSARNSSALHALPTRCRAGSTWMCRRSCTWRS